MIYIVAVMGASDGLVEFAVIVASAIERLDASGRFGHRKVFVSAIWAALDDADRAGWTITEFKARLFEAHRTQLLSLARADLVAAMSAELVAASEIEHQGATFHFVVDRSACELWS